ncbi:hypothetical protein [Candidatus Palauibacter sp.]|uniref:hypothetical protein n=1 Tax=Candidatus Palauibacter sp. TaxID=3101350 RepID=UPI003B58C033
MRRWDSVTVTALAAVLAGCNESSAPGPDGPGVVTPDRSDIAILNSISGTLQQFNRIDDRLVPFGQDIQLGAGFDGESVDFLQDLWVTTSDAPGGSQVLFGSFSTGEQTVAAFPGNASVDPGKPTVIADAAGTLGALVPARGLDAIFVAFPGAPVAQLVIERVGTFVERAVPAGLFIVSIDANLDDEGGELQPLGPPRMALHEFLSGSFFDELRLPEGTTGATEALVLEDNLLFLAGGSLDPATSAPMGNGSLVEINVTARGVQDTNTLGGNGLSMEPGRNGLIYIVRTRDTTTDTDVLTFNFSVRVFERGPDNPIQPLDRDGSSLNCRVVSAFLDGEMLCSTYETGSRGRLILLSADGEFISDTPTGAGTTDIILR